MREPFVKELQRVPPAGLQAVGVTYRQNADVEIFPENLSTNRNHKFALERPPQPWVVPRRSRRPSSSPWRKSHHGPSFRATAGPTGARLPAEASGTVKTDPRPEAQGTTNLAAVLSSASIPANRAPCQCRWPTAGARQPATSHAASARAAFFLPMADSKAPCGPDPTERPAAPGGWRHAMPFLREQSANAASRCFPRPGPEARLPQGRVRPDRPSRPPEAVNRVEGIQRCQTKRHDPPPSHRRKPRSGEESGRQGWSLPVQGGRTGA